MKTLITLFLLLISFVGFSQTKIENVDAATFKKMIDEKKSYLIDLRTDDELKNKGFIKGATQIDFFKKDAELIISKLDKQKTYLVYCAAGGRSEQCAELMQKEGFKHVVNLAKGFDDWKKNGFEVELKK
jgi:rhodanese-related sulfurtransferase